jgi:DNA-binding CsgD family transcriptional regulator
MLNDVRRALAQSQGSTVLISGEAGIGKSRLLAQFLRTAREGRVRNIATAECLEVAQRPFGPIREWVTGLLHKTRVASFSPSIRRALAHLSPDAVAEASADDASAPLEKADLLAALAAFLRVVAAERATILVVEDLHWADPSTLEAVTFLSSRVTGTRLMLVATYRSEELATNEALAATVARVLRENGTRTIALDSLSESEVKELIEHTLDGHHSLPREDLRAVERQCEGNPFFAEELLKSAIEHRTRRRVPGLPLSIRASILERMTALGEEERRIIAGAAVIGYRFDPQVLALTLGLEVDALLPALRRARNLNIVVDDDTAGTRFRFRHALTRETIYADMMPFDARRSHARILGILESLSDPNAHLDELAYHAWAARDAAKTLEYNERAGEAALEVHGTVEARLYYERALSVATDSDDEARLLERVGAVAQLQGRSPDALDAFEAALAIRRGRAEYDSAADLVRMIITERNNVSDLDGVGLGESFLAECGHRVGDGSRDALLALMARLASARFDFAAAESALSRLVAPEAMAPRARQNRLIAELELHLYHGDAEAWHRTASRLSDVVAELPAFLSAIVLYTIVQGGTFLGAHLVVERALARVEVIEQRCDFGALFAFGAAVRAMYWYQRGRLDLARPWVERCLERPDAVVAQMMLATVGPLVALALDDEALADRCQSDAAIREARQGTITPDDSNILCARAAWLAVHGRLGEARADARRALEALRRPAPSCGIVLVVAAELLDACDLSRAESLFDSTSLRNDDAVGRANVLLASAIRERRFGDAEKAAARAAAAAPAFRELGWPLFEARALEVAGNIEEAIARYVQSGATADVRRLSGAGTQRRARRLSAREVAVAELVSDGLGNVAIAERLAVSAKTVEKYIASLFAKLNVHSRAQIAAAFVRDEMERAPDSNPAKERRARSL